MADGLRAASNVVPFYNALHVHLVETSPLLQNISKPLSPPSIVRFIGMTRFVQVPDGPFVLLANEFLDALPIRQFAGTAGVWRERLIDLTTAGDALEWTSSTSFATDGLHIPPALAPGAERSNLRGLPGGPFYHQ